MTTRVDVRDITEYFEHKYPDRTDEDRAKVVADFCRLTQMTLLGVKDSVGNKAVVEMMDNVIKQLGVLTEACNATSINRIDPAEHYSFCRLLSGMAISTIGLAHVFDMHIQTELERRVWEFYQ